MMLTMEISLGGSWRTIDPVLRHGDRPGSLSDNTLESREIILFACDKEQAVVYRSLAGLDNEPSPLTREIMSTNLEILAVLSPGKSYEKDIITDSGRHFRVRWTCVP
jgi:hypothetical protein